MKVLGHDALKNFIRLFEFTNRTRVDHIWYWHPYHSTGLRFYQWLKMQSLTDSKSQDFILENITYSHSSMDPSLRIKETLSKLSQADFFVIPAERLTETLKGWEPKIEIEDFMTLKPVVEAKLLQRFSRLSPWEKLFLLESLDGVAISHTTLKFQRIDPDARIF